MIRHGLKSSFSSIHFIILGIYFPIALLAANLGEVFPLDFFRPLFVSLLLAILILVISQVILRDWNKSALIASVFVIMFFSYGHLYGFIKSWAIADFPIGRHRFFAPLWGILLLACIWWIIRYKGRTSSIGEYFSIVAIVLITFPLFNEQIFYPKFFKKPKKNHPARPPHNQLRA
jgi:hypothetical protein